MEQLFATAILKKIQHLYLPLEEVRTQKNIGMRQVLEERDGLADLDGTKGETGQHLMETEEDYRRVAIDERLRTAF